MMTGRLLNVHTALYTVEMLQGTCILELQSFRPVLMIIKCTV